MEDKKLYYIAKKSIPTVFDDVPNTIDAITNRISKLWDWEHAGYFRRFSDEDDAKFALFVYFIREGLSFDETMKKLSRMNVIIFGEDTGQSVYENCDICWGEGSIECGECNGGGEVECDRCDGSGVDPSEDECSECNGRGEVDCPICDGDGKEICHECDGRGDYINPDKTEYVISTFISFDPILSNELKQLEKLPVNYQQVVKNPNLIHVSTYEFQTELQSEYENETVVLDVIVSPYDMSIAIFGDEQYLDKRYVYYIS